MKQLISRKNIAAASDINRELILRFQPRWKTDIEVMVGKTNIPRLNIVHVMLNIVHENGFVNNFETHGAS